MIAVAAMLYNQEARAGVPNFLYTPLSISCCMEMAFASPKSNYTSRSYCRRLAWRAWRRNVGKEKIIKKEAREKNPMG